MNLSNLGITLSILCFFISAFANFCNEAFGFEIRHLVSVSNIAAKSYCKVELFSLFLNYLSIILYVFLFSKYFNIYHILMIFIHGIGGVMYFIYLPYYNLLGNFMKSLMHVFTFFSSIIILAGYREESAFFCVLGILLLIPLMFWIWYQILRYRNQRIKATEVLSIRNI